MKSSISSLVGIWKIRHSSPGCSLVRILRVVYFPLKHSCLINKKIEINYKICVAWLDCLFGFIGITFTSGGRAYWLIFKNKFNHVTMFLKKTSLFLMNLEKLSKVSSETPGIPQNSYLPIITTYQYHLLLVRPLEHHLLPL